MNRSQSSKPSVLILGTAEWSQLIATNQHYMTRELALDYQVTFVESLGLRRPEINRRDLARILARLRRVFTRSKPNGESHDDRRPVPVNATVVSPIVIPYHTGLARFVNHALIRFQLRKLLRSEGHKVLWVYTPVTYGLESEFSGAFYHCVDLLGDVPGISKSLIEGEERRLAAAGVQAAASSDAVLSHLSSMGFSNVRRWPNVADVAAIQQSRPQSVARSPRSVVFAGNLTATKVDFELIAAIQRAGWQVHLAGPISEGGGNAAAMVAELQALGVVYHGMLALPELGALYWRCEIGIIPYVVNSYTLGVNPLKTYEYLAAGLPVVSTPIPAVTAQTDDVVVASTTAEFLEALRSLRLSESDEKRRVQVATLNSWTQRGQQGREVVELLGRG
ncbi:glycosyltransferase [Microbacterium schleiferi]|uniref:Glycosyltransferase n=1 Tax=Microbacterium schleiferi TaxID=69362 RepID=A0A7S8MY01_9MICO|nr:glycosyltransferase [Microbacterium schleiferi]QPE05003.1 glycosyltransferase [Microbacterium schleiferi]